MLRTRLGFVLATLAVAAAPARADFAVLDDGRVVEGVVIEQGEDALVLKYLNGDVRLPLDRVSDWFIEGAPPPEPRTEEEKAKRAEGLVPFRGDWMKPEKRDRLLDKEREERRKAFDEWKSHREWIHRYTFQTRNFNFESTLPPELNDRYADLLETYFKEFGKLWRVRIPRDWGRLNVFLHNGYESFSQVSGAAAIGRGVQAYYRFVEPRELHFFHDRSNPRSTVATMFHEANHYLTDLMDDRFQYPHWLNEAMAEYYGASSWDPDRKRLETGGLQHGRLAELQRDIAGDSWYDLREIVASESRDYRHYYWGWSLVHFLMESKKYRKGFMRFFADLANGSDVKRRSGSFNFREVSGDECLRVFLTRLSLREEDLPELQKEWHAHIASLESGGVTGVEEAGLSAFRQGMTKFRAPRLLKEAIDAGSRRTQVHIRYALCLLLKGGSAAVDSALEVLDGAQRIDPLDPWVYAFQSSVRALRSTDDPDVDRLLALARELDPEEDFIEARLLVGSKKVAEGD